VLRPSQEHVARQTPLKRPPEPSGRCHPDETAGCFRATVHEERRYGHTPEDHNPIECQQRHPLHLLALGADDDGVVFELQEGALRGHVQSVDRVTHRPPRVAGRPEPGTPELGLARS